MCFDGGKYKILRKPRGRALTQRQRKWERLPGRRDNMRPWKINRSMTSDGLPWVSGGKESACNWGALGLTPGLGRPPGRGRGIPAFSAGESPRTEEPDRLQSMGSQRVRHGWTTKLSTAQCAERTSNYGTLWESILKIPSKERVAWWSFVFPCLRDWWSKKRIRERISGE